MAGRPRLAGYAATAASPDDLRAFLAERLPSYLVPDYLVPMAALPWTPNGKVDKAALPAPEAAADHAPAPARTDTEHQVAALWQDLLGVDAVDAEDDFFGLGGYSLLVARMLAQVEEAFGRSVPLSVLNQALALMLYQEQRFGMLGCNQTPLAASQGAFQVRHQLF